MDVTTPILYVEDDGLSRMVMEMLLKRQLKFSHVTVFDDSADFVPRVEALTPKPRLFLLDIHLSPLNGFDMLRALRCHADFQKARVVALTASVMNEEVQQLQDAGFDGVIAKPVDQLTFSDTLHRILRGEQFWNVL